MLEVPTMVLILEIPAILWLILFTCPPMRATIQTLTSDQDFYVGHRIPFVDADIRSAMRQATLAKADVKVIVNLQIDTQRLWTEALAIGALGLVLLIPFVARARRPAARASAESSHA